MRSARVSTPPGVGSVLVSSHTAMSMPATPLAAPMATIFCSALMAADSSRGARFGHGTKVPVKLRPMTGPNTESRQAPRHALRGPALTFVADPFEAGVDAAMRYESDAVLVMESGKITHFGPASAVLPGIPADTPVRATGG